jgi:hypothetical protein
VDIEYSNITVSQPNPGGAVFATCTATDYDDDTMKLVLVDNGALIIDMGTETPEDQMTCRIDPAVEVRLDGFTDKLSQMRRAIEDFKRGRREAEAQARTS